MEPSATSHGTSHYDIFMIIYCSKKILWFAINNTSTRIRPIHDLLKVICIIINFWICKKKSTCNMKWQILQFAFGNLTVFIYFVDNVTHLDYSNSWPIDHLVHQKVHPFIKKINLYNVPYLCSCSDHWMNNITFW